MRLCRISNAGQSALAGLRVGQQLLQPEYARVVSYVRQLEQDIQHHAAEHEQLQSEVNVACSGLERECATLRQEITSTMQCNRQLQAQLDAEKQRTEPLKDFASELRRLHAELERVQAERQRGDELLRSANEEAARMQRLYTDEVERRFRLRFVSFRLS